MNKLFKLGLTAFAMIFILSSCDDSESDGNPSSTFLSINFTDSDEADGVQANDVTVSIDLRASEGLRSLSVTDGTTTDAVTVTMGETAETVSYTYTVAADETSDVTLTFTVTDMTNATAEATFSISTVENGSSFCSIGSVDLGAGEGAAEIAVFDSATNVLFVVNNDDVAGNVGFSRVDLSDPTSPSDLGFTDLSGSGAGVNSVAVDRGRLAVALEAATATDAGTVLYYASTSDLTSPTSLTVGALPDMLTFSPDGNYLVVANEGEPSDDYLTDPEGSVSVIDVSGSTPGTPQTATFTAFNGSVPAGMRVFGANSPTLAEDVEPEYIAIDGASEKAYVTLQENNGLAIVDLATATVDAVVGLGYKDYTSLGIDANDNDDVFSPISGYPFPIFGMYQPDAIAAFEVDGTTYLITANEGDARDYGGFSEEVRVEDITVEDPISANVQVDEFLGRLQITNTLGDAEPNGSFEALYSYGGRSFSIWGTDGTLIFDSGLDTEIQANAAGVYPDGRSDAKGTEPEGVTVGVVGGQTLAFIGLERADAVLVYDVSVPTAPTFLSVLNTGDAPEGLVFIPADQSPNGSSLLIVSSEDDGVVTIYQTGN